MAHQRHYRTAQEHENDLLKTENDRLTIALLESRLSMLSPLVVFAKENPDIMYTHRVETGTSFKELRS